MMTTALGLLLNLLQPAPPPACASARHREFDFWIGTWEVTGPSGKLAGTNRIEPADGGCLLIESWSSAAGGYTGHSLNSVGADGRWHQTWVDSSGLRLELAGGLVEGRMVLEGETPAAAPGAPPVKNRITWTPSPDGNVRQHWETSADAGKTYTTAFDGLYHPVTSRAPRASETTERK